MNMNDSFHVLMRDANRMVQSGQLMDATQAIQRALGGLPPADGYVSPAGGAERAPLKGLFPVRDGTFPKAFVGAEGFPLHVPTPEFHFPARPDSTWQGFTMPASLPGAAPASVPEVAPGAQLIAGSFTNAAGTRGYKLYVPSGYEGQAQALPLVVMLHGGTQHPDDFASGTRMNALAEEYPCLVLYPVQAPWDNALKCWNWFKEGDQQRDGGEPSLIAGMTQEIMATYRVDARRVYVAGMSAGGAMAAVMGATYPDLFAAVGVHSGLAPGAAHDLPSALAAMKGMGMAPARPLDASGVGTGSESRTVPTIVFHGDRDTIVNPRNADQIILQGTSKYHARSGTKPHLAVQPGQVPGGHAYMHTVYRDADGHPFQELWQVHGAGHAWAGGSTNGSYTDPKGPDASREMLRFFDEHPLADGETQGLLVRPDIACKQMDDERAKTPVDVTPVGPTTGGVGPTTTEPGEGPTGTTIVPPPKPSLKRFHGTVTLDAIRVGRDASRIADEVIAHLSGLVGAKVTVTLVVEADIPSGAPDHVVCTVTENSRTLKFTSQDFEKE